MQKIEFIDLGVKDYKETWDYQEQLFSKLQVAPLESDLAGHLIFVEHPHVFTLGKSGDQGNLLINEQLLSAKGATFYKINRGGDITYHGPGQVVGYPIIHLGRFEIGIRSYIEYLEETIIRTLRHYDIEAGRLAGASGVWLDFDKITARKICAIGVRASRQVTMHGFAFNVNTDLSFYQLINPCGFVDKGVTSMQKELGQEVNFEKLKGVLLQEFLSVFGAKV